MLPRVPLLLLVKPPRGVHVVVSLAVPDEVHALRSRSQRLCTSLCGLPTPHDPAVRHAVAPQRSKLIHPIVDEVLLRLVHRRPVRAVLLHWLPRHARHVTDLGPRGVTAAAAGAEGGRRSSTLSGLLLGARRSAGLGGRSRAWLITLRDRRVAGCRRGWNPG